MVLKILFTISVTINIVIIIRNRSITKERNRYHSALWECVKCLRNKSKNFDEIALRICWGGLEGEKFDQVDESQSRGIIG